MKFYGEANQYITIQERGYSFGGKYMETFIPKDRILYPTIENSRRYPKMVTMYVRLTNGKTFSSTLVFREEGEAKTCFENIKDAVADWGISSSARYY